MGFSGATVLLTGGSSGIGAATARTLAASGARVLVAGRNGARLRAVAAETGGIAIEADLAAPDGPAVLAAAAVRAAAAWNAPAGHLPMLSLNTAKPPDGPPPGAWLSSGTSLVALPGQAKSPVPPPAAGGIDILINNAGVGWSGPLTDMGAADVARLVAVNLTAPIELTRLLTPSLAAGGRGRVVFISSIAGATGAPHEAVYAATKAGLTYFAESLRFELAGSGVGVSVVVPGVIDTPFFARRGRPYSRRRPVPISAQRAARTVLTAIEREQPVAFVPRWLGFPAWLHGVAPGTFRALAARFG